MAEGQAEVKIVTMDAVANLGELRKQISEAKKALDGMNVGSKEYRAQLKEVITGQNLLRAAMNGTTATAEHLKDAIDENGTSYNSLVNQMANLKREFRATTDEVRRANLGEQIKGINDELKRMDAMKGDFQRNVGDYFNQVAEPLKQAVADLPSGLAAIRQPMDDLGKSMSLMSKQPILGIIGLLSPLLVKIAESLKEDEGAMNAVKKAMDTLKPVTDFFASVLDTIVGTLTDLIDRAATFLGSSGIFQKVVQGAVGVGNAIVQFIVAPIKGVIGAIKVFKEEGVKGFRNAWKAFQDEAEKGVAFKSNFQTGQVVADTIMAGAKSRKKEAQDTGKAIVKEMAKGAEESIDELIAKAFDRAEKAAAERLRKRQADESFVDSLIAENLAGIEAEMDAYFEAERVMQEESVRVAKEAAEQKLAAMAGYADGASSIVGSIADILESSTEESEKNTKAVKALRIASTIIDTISGAVSAYVSTWSSTLPLTAKAILAPVNAATVVAAGMANVAKMRSTTVSASSAPTGDVSVAASVPAPSLSTSVPTTTVVNGAKTETALNNAAQPQRVYILQSDIEAAENASRTQVAESSF